MPASTGIDTTCPSPWTSRGPSGVSRSSVRCGRAALGGWLRLARTPRAPGRRTASRATGQGPRRRVTGPKRDRPPRGLPAPRAGSPRNGPSPALLSARRGDSRWFRSAGSRTHRYAGRVECPRRIAEPSSWRFGAGPRPRGHRRCDRWRRSPRVIKGAEQGQRADARRQATPARPRW